MTVTHCITPFARRIGQTPTTHEAYQAELAAIPETCPSIDLAAVEADLAKHYADRKTAASGDA